MNWTRIQLLNNEDGSCGLRLVDEKDNGTNILTFRADSFREIANAINMVADKADSVKQFGPDILKDMESI